MKGERRRGEGEERGHEGEALKGYPSRPPLKGGFKGVLKERGLEGGRRGVKVKPWKVTLQGFRRVTLEGLPIKFP